jgi:hypothetical protein
MVNLGLAARAACRSLTVRAVVLAAFALAAINVYAGHAQATICNPLDPCAGVLDGTALASHDPTEADCQVDPVQDGELIVLSAAQRDGAIDAEWCEPDEKAGHAGSLVDAVALSPGLCTVQVAGGEENNALWPVDETVTASVGGPQLQDVEQDTATAVACASTANNSTGREYYKPRARYESCDGNICQNGNNQVNEGGDLAYRLDNYGDEYHCGGWNDDNCTTQLTVRDSRNRQYGRGDPRFDAGGGGQGEFGGSWDRRKGPLRPYCEQHFDHATLWCSSYYYDN